MYAQADRGLAGRKYHIVGNPHLRKPRVLTPLRSLRVRNEVELVPLACEDGKSHAIAHVISSSVLGGIPLGIGVFAVNVLLCYFQRQRERPESTERSPRRRSVRCPDIHIEDERNGLLTYESPPRNRTRRNSESRIYDSDFRSILHDISWAQPRHADTAMYSEADELSMSESVEMSDFDDNYQFIYSEHERGGHDTRYIRGHVDALPTRYIGGHFDALPTRYIGGHVDTPPSYHEAIVSAPPNKTSFNNSSRSASPPSYDDFLTNQSRYATSS